MLWPGIVVFYSRPLPLGSGIKLSQLYVGAVAAKRIDHTVVVVIDAETNPTAYHENTSLWQYSPRVCDNIGSSYGLVVLAR